MKTLYYTNGSMDDTEGAGVTVASYQVDEDGAFQSPIMQTMDGEPFLGYRPREVSEKEYLVWKERIAAPDMVEYYPSMFPGIGVVGKLAYTVLQAKRSEGLAKKLDAEVSANRVNYKLAKLDAEAIDESVEDVFRSKHPKVSQKAFAILNKMV